MMLRSGDGEDLCRSFILEEEVSLCCWLIVNGQFCGIGVVTTFFLRLDHAAYFFLVVHLESAEVVESAGVERICHFSPLN